MGSVMRFSTLDFFHQSTPTRALIHGLKTFCLWLQARQEILDNQADSMRPRKRIQDLNETPRILYNTAEAFAKSF
jgi:hypothetical protein